MDKFLGFKTDEILTCLLLIVVGYVIAKMFNGCSNNGFSVGIQRRSDGNNCVDGETCNAGGDTQYRYPCPGGGQCYNLVLDDGTDKNCKNPEGVYGDSNDTYCIQGGLPNPNIPVDCVGHWDDDNCDQNCERKYVVDTPASNGGIQCDDIGKTKKCKKGQGKCPGGLPIPPYVILTDIDGIEEKIEFKDYRKNGELLIEIDITNSNSVYISPIINPSKYSDKIYLIIKDFNKSSQLQKLPEDFLYGLVDAVFTNITISLENGYIGKNFFKQIKFSGDILYLNTLDNASVVKGLIIDVDTKIFFGENITPNMNIDGLDMSSCKLINIEYRVLKNNKFQHCYKKL